MALIQLEELISGPLLTKAGGLPLIFRAMLCDLRPRMIAKGRVGRSYRAVARNGRILLASNRPLDQLTGQVARVRIQAWNRAILPGESPELCGLLLHVRCDDRAGETPLYIMQLVTDPSEGFDLTLDVGGRMILAVHRSRNEEL